MKLIKITTFGLIISLLFACKSNSEPAVNENGAIQNKTEKVAAKKANNRNNVKPVAKPAKQNQQANALRKKQQKTSGQKNEMQRKLEEGVKKKQQNNGKYDKYDKISNKKIGKYHLDEIKKINMNFNAKIKSAKDAKLKKAFIQEKELALKRFLGDKLYQEYKAKIKPNR